MKKTQSLFPTLIYRATLPATRATKLNRELLKDIDYFSSEDRMGQDWSEKNYLGGYTSYGSLSDMHHRAPSFATLEKILNAYATDYSKKLNWEIRGLKLEMTSCWINIMPSGTYHTLHHHPQSVISGTYYVQTPPGSVSLKLEDPRTPFFMNSPARKSSAPKTEQGYFPIEAKSGSLVLFESWMRHEVPPNQSKKPRISISFNYEFSRRD